MGFSVGMSSKANSSTSVCPYGSYPFYVWFADGIENEIWNLMDTQFDYWHNKTEKNLAFFVDPFQKDEWAREHLTKNDYDQSLIDEILLARGTLQEYYRERLSTNIARHFRIGKEFLPIAVIALQWNAPVVVVCFLQNQNGLERLFEELIGLNQKPDKFIRLSKTNQYQNESLECGRKTRLLWRELREKFDVQVYDIPVSFLDDVNIPIDPSSIDKLTTERKDYDQRSFEFLTAKVAMASLNDLITVAEDIDKIICRIENRYGEDSDVEKLCSCLKQLRIQKEQIDKSLTEIRQAINNKDDIGVMDALKPLEKHARKFDLDEHLISILGIETVEALSAASKDAVTTSELIYLLSEVFNDLKRDLTGAMVGYWKASELEGRRVLLKLLSQKFELSYRANSYPNEKRTSITVSKVGYLTLGGLRKVFKGLNILPRERAPHLPSRELGKLLGKVTFNDRNEATHFKLITNPDDLQAARTRMGCQNPIGILPLLVSCLEAIDPKLVPLSEIDDKNQKISIDTTCDWIGTKLVSKKGKPKFQIRGGKAYGILHPSNKTPNDIVPNKTYKMRVVTGGDIYQLEWIPE